MGHWSGYGPDRQATAGIGVTEGVLTRTATSGALTYEPYYGLTSKAFSLSTDPRPLYKSPTHAAVFEDVLAAIRRREGIIVLTGEMGTGKTTLCRAALCQLDRKTFTTFVSDPSLSREDLLRMLLVGFGEVSVNDLKQGRLKDTPRAELGCQLYEFLTSLESVDAFAVLVIDEAQLLEGRILDEIRALSEMEAGRRLLQIVLVGQPELRTRLKLPEMQQVAQRVTTVRELRPLSREEVGGYVSHRLAFAGGTRDRIEFSPDALDLVFGASGGVPRIVNLICDRAMSLGHLDRSATIGQFHVARAVHDLELVIPAAQRAAARVPPGIAVPRVSQEAPVTRSPGGLFVKTTAADAAAVPSADLAALLDLPAVARQTTQPGELTPRIERPLANRDQRRRITWLRRTFGSVWPAAVGMLVMLLGGGAAVSTVGAAMPDASLPHVPPSPLRATGAPAARAIVTITNESFVLAGSAAPAPTAGLTWVVQVGAFASRERATSSIARLAAQGWPVYLEEPDDAGTLAMVLVGPYESAGAADEARSRLRASSDYRTAFVRTAATAK